MNKSNILASLKSLAWACLVLIVGYGLVFSLGQDPFHEFRLLRSAKVVTAKFDHLYEKEYDEGATHEGGIYTFKVHGSDEEFYAATLSSADYVQTESVQVEYDPSDPLINRVKGDGSQTWFEWAWRFALKLLLFFGFVFPIVWFLIKQARDELSSPVDNSHVEP